MTLYNIAGKDELQAVTSEHIKCPACRNGDFPNGAHKCMKCNKPVHVFDDCSHSAGEAEGYGEKRICKDCFAGHTQNSGYH